ITPANSQRGPAPRASLAPATDPAALMGCVEELEHVLAEVSTGKRRFEIADQPLDTSPAVDALHDFSGTRRELDHALRIEQDPRRLRLLELQADLPGDLRHVVESNLHFRQHIALGEVHRRSASHRASTTARRA